MKKKKNISDGARSSTGCQLSGQAAAEMTKKQVLTEKQNRF